MSRIGWHVTKEKRWQCVRDLAARVIELLDGGQP
jgi:hypothetical protein